MELSSETKKTTLGLLAALALMVRAIIVHKEKISLRMRMGSGVIEPAKERGVNRTQRFVLIWPTTIPARVEVTYSFPGLLCQ